MPEGPAGGLPPASIEFGSIEWAEEVGRLSPRAPARTHAERARKMIEAGAAKLLWKRCRADGPGGTRLPGCRKLYVPLGSEAASEAPYGFIFQLVEKADGSLAWNMIAFGERHPSDRRSRTVYERAHTSAFMVGIRRTRSADSGHRARSLRTPNGGFAAPRRCPGRG